MTFHRPLTHREQATMVFVRRCVVTAMWVVALAGGACHWPGIDTHEKHPVYPTTQDKYQPAPLPPMATNKQAMVRAMAVTEMPATNTVGLGWSNAQPEWVNRAVTGIEASSDLVHWSEVFLTNYTVGETVCWLSNRPAREFYRALNRGL